MEKEDGVWRTIRGRRVFIAKGETLGQAMAKSGKFNRSDIRETKEGLSQIDRFNKTNSQSLKQRQKAINKMRSKSVKYSNSVYDKDRQDKKFSNYYLAKPLEKGKTRVERNITRYSEADKRELMREHRDLQKKLADYNYAKAQDDLSNNTKKWEGRYDVGNNKYDDLEKERKEILNRLEKARIKGNINTQEKSDKIIADYKAKKQSNNRLTDMQEKDKKALERYNKYKISGVSEEEAYKLKQEKEKQSNNKIDTSNNFKNNWQDEIKTKEQLLAKEKEVKEYYDNYKKQVESHKNEWDATTIRKNEESYQKTLKNIEDWKKEFDSEDDKFIQNTNMYGGTREYSKEDLKRMEEQGIRPMKDSYTGGGWKGVNADKNLSTSEQAKAITTEMKKQFPDVKIARRSDVYAGGSSIDFNIMSSDKDLYITEKDIDNLSNEQIHNMLNDYNNGLTPYFDRWAEQNVSSYKSESTYTMDDVKRYMKEDVKNLKSRENQNVRGNEYYLSDYGKKVVSALNKEANSYTFDDSDGQIDYFHHGTYMDISIGKWNKPYQVNDTKAKIEKYKKRKG